MSLERPLPRIRLARLVAASLVAALLASTSGCGGATGEVSGKVSHKNKAVVYGFVAFVGKDGAPRTSRINPDGSYTVKDVSVGEAKITVVSELPPTTAPGGRDRDDPDRPKDLPKREPRGEEKPEVVDAEVARKWFAIPADYGDLNKTKLRFTVKSGSNTHDIKLD